MPHVAEIPPSEVYDSLPVHVVTNGDARADGAVAEENPAERGASGSYGVQVVAGDGAPAALSASPAT